MNTNLPACILLRIACWLALAQLVAATSSADAMPPGDPVSGPTTTLDSSATPVNQSRKTEAFDTGHVIPWRRLAPANGRPFSDGFVSLTSEQLSDLSYAVRVQRLITEEKLHSDGADAKEAAEILQRLSDDGVDVDWLLAQRESIRHIRDLQVTSVSRSIAQSLSGTTVTLNGYVIPVTMHQDKLVEFFLVPTIAACSHEDPPPRLKIVFVKCEQGLVPPGKRTPLSVTGAVTARSTARTIVNGNGRVLINSAYAMSSPQVTVFHSDE